MDKDKIDEINWIRNLIEHLQKFDPEILDDVNKHNIPVDGITILAYSEKGAVLAHKGWFDPIIYAFAAKEIVENATELRPAPILGGDEPFVI